MSILFNHVKPIGKEKTWKEGRFGSFKGSVFEPNSLGAVLLRAHFSHGSLAGSPEVEGAGSEWACSFQLPSATEVGIFEGQLTEKYEILRQKLRRTMGFLRCLSRIERFASLAFCVPGGRSLADSAEAWHRKTREDLFGEVQVLDSS